MKTSTLLPGFLNHSMCFSNSPHALTCPFLKSLSSNYPNWSVFSVIFLNVFIFGCSGSWWLRAGFLQLWREGPAPRGRVQASHCGHFSYSGARALGTQVQKSWCTGLVALRHVDSSQTRDRTCVLCISRWILIHRTTREVPLLLFVRTLILSIHLFIHSFI